MILFGQCKIFLGIRSIKWDEKILLMSGCCFFGSFSSFLGLVLLLLFSRSLLSSLSWGPARVLFVSSFAVVPPGL